MLKIDMPTWKGAAKISSMNSTNDSRQVSALYIIFCDKQRKIAFYS